MPRAVSSCTFPDKVVEFIGCQALRNGAAAEISPRAERFKFSPRAALHFAEKPVRVTTFRNLLGRKFLFFSRATNLKAGTCGELIASRTPSIKSTRFVAPIPFLSGVMHRLNVNK